jgi:hypothetical protein
MGSSQPGLNFNPVNLAEIVSQLHGKLISAWYELEFQFKPVSKCSYFPRFFEEFKMLFMSIT